MSDTYVINDKMIDFASKKSLLDSKVALAKQNKKSFSVGTADNYEYGSRQSTDYIYTFNLETKT